MHTLFPDETVTCKCNDSHKIVALGSHEAKYTFQREIIYVILGTMQ
jgi:hypothetical protein